MSIAIEPNYNRIEPCLQVVNKRQTIKPLFRAQSDTFSFTGAARISEKSFDEIGRVKSVTFTEPSAPYMAIGALIDDPKIALSLVLGGHSMKELSNFKTALANSDVMQDINVKSLVGCGAFALAFETDDGNILKIISYDHFDGRQPESFDLPIIKSGKLGEFPPCYYYIEEKVSQDDVTQDDMRAVVDDICEQGYVVRDIMEGNKDFYCDKDALFRTDQFGRASDGKVYLLDPGCIKPLSFSDILGMFF